MTIFTTTSYPVGALIADIDLGKVRLPDLQRPFVWRNGKRDAAPLLLSTAE